MDYAYICTYNNNTWVPVHWSKITDNNQVVFTKMGRDVTYLVAYYKYRQLIPAGPAFTLQADGTLRTLEPDLTAKRTIKLYKTHPIYSSDSIQTGNRYELFYWNNEWVSLSKNKANGKYITFYNIPDNAIFWLLHADRSSSEEKERIFTIENGAQKWW